MRPAWAAIGGVAILACTGLAADNRPGLTPDTAWIEKLGSNLFSEREQAVRALVDRGPEVIPELQTLLTQNSDPEVRERAESIIELIQRNNSSTQLIATKQIRLDYRDIPLSAVIADLKSKTSIPLLLVPGEVADPTRRITLVSDEPVTAWDAVRRLCHAAQLREEIKAEVSPQSKTTSMFSPSSRIVSLPSPNDRSELLPGDVPISLVDGTPMDLPMSCETAVRVMATPGRFPTNKIVRGAGRIIITLDVAPFPGLNWQEVTSVRVTQAEDEDGRPMFSDLKPQNDIPNNSYSPWGWGGAVFFDDQGNAITGARTVENPRLVGVPLRTDDRSIRKLKVFEGVVVGEINQTNVPIFSIHSLSEAAGRPPLVGANDSKFSIVSYNEDAKGKTSVRIRVEMWQQWVLQQIKRGGLNNNRMFWGGGWSDSLNNVPQQLAWTDADGRTCSKPQQTSTSYTGDGWRQTVEIEFQFNKSDKHGAPKSVVMKGTKPITVEVPFKLTNVDLP